MDDAQISVLVAAALLAICAATLAGVFWVAFHVPSECCVSHG